MSNTSRIQRAILINWKGIFFQSFAIDPGMTILEGANGTGKTTIMIAIYTCLIPDLNFLNFQNVTSVSTRRNEDKGLYGRIGQDEKNREEPIFSLLDILTSNGTRHLIGVQLIKKTYPQVALRHFAINNLSLDADVEKLLLRHTAETNLQEIPELEEIGEACKQYGGQLNLFRHAKDYFQFLFDENISPIRLIENEERKKYNQLLHTSLYGGLSRSLQTSLRDYLLPENDKLVQGIQEMEQNLKTCRRTRSAIQRYQSVREVIRQVYDAGLEMYSNAFFATRLEAELQTALASKTREARKALKSKLAGCQQTLESVRQQQQTQEAALASKNEELDLAKQRLNRCLAATKIAREYQAKEAEFLKQNEREASARTEYRKLKDTQDALHGEERSLSKQQMALATQLSDAGQAWQELSKQVGLYQQAEKLLNEAKLQLNLEHLTVDAIGEQLTQVRTACEQTKNHHQQIYIQLNDALLKQEHFTVYLNLLQRITGEEVDPAQAGEKAKTTIASLFALEQRIKAADQLPAMIGQLNEKIRNRERLLLALKTADLGSINSLAAYDSTRNEILAQLKAGNAKQKENQAERETYASELRAITERLPVLERQLGEWEQYQKALKELENKTATSITNAIELANLQAALEEQVQQLNLEKYELKSKQKHWQQAFHTLINERSPIAGMKNLADQGFGTLLASRYEEIPADWAANLECRLGPVVNALVVKQIHKAANELTASFDRPDEVWLVEDAFKEKLPEAIELGDSMLVKHGDAWRLSRMPADPVLGKEARGRQLEILETRIHEIAAALEKNDQTLRHLKETLHLTGKLALTTILFQGSSPLEVIKELGQRQLTLQGDLKRKENENNRLAKQISRLEEQEDSLRQFYPLRDLLDDTDLEQQLQSLQSEWDETQALEASNREKFPLLPQLHQGVELLLQFRKQAVEALQHSEAEARNQLDSQRSSLELLERLNACLPYFQYQDRVALLAEKKSINQHTESQLAKVEQQLSALKQASEQNDQAVKKAEESFQREEARLNTLRGQLELLKENLSQAGASGAESDLDLARKRFSALEAELKLLENERNQTQEQRYQLEAETHQLGGNLTQTNERLKIQRNASQPAIKKWSQFRRLAQTEAKFTYLQDDFVSTIRDSGKKPEGFWRKVSALRVSLLATLEKIHDARTVLERIREIIASDPEETNQAEVGFKIWQELRHYIGQVIPMDLQTSDPEKAQEAIGQKLTALEQNLEQQEHSLRVHVQSIPSHLNAEIRKQKSRIRKLNDKLEQVRFGFLQTIRIHIETHPKLKRFLDILPQQLDIFAEANEDSVSIESLMADLYEKEGAGKVKGDLLLDYRHYVRLTIEVKREGNLEFEKVTSTNLSTGESIGVGIAILIMVLMSWEEQSYLTKESEQRGSIRFLLLDESSRLDQKALQTLSEFCQSLGLQLLIAAPSVERTLKGTTHHLTRGHFNGREEVFVRGRRITALTPQ